MNEDLIREIIQQLKLHNTQMGYIHKELERINETMDDQDNIKDINESISEVSNQVRNCFGELQELKHIGQDATTWYKFSMNEKPNKSSKNGR